MLNHCNNKNQNSNFGRKEQKLYAVHVQKWEIKDKNITTLSNYCFLSSSKF